jgi:ribonuclease P protein component
MIARAHRFHGYGSLRFVYSRGQVVRGSLCMFKYASNPKRKTWRVAVVVSRKVHKSAVVRNRIRRRVYDIVRHAVSADLPATDIVCVVHSADIATMPADELQKTLVAQLEKVIYSNK